jgi:Zn-dependent peptidase ImmA (M78 family)
VETLRRTAEAFEVDLRDLLTTVRELTHVRFRARRRLASRENLLAKVARWLDDYAELERLLGLSPRWLLGEVAARAAEIPRGTTDRGRDVAAVLRSHAGLRDEPIRDVAGFIESLGVKLLAIPVASDGFFGLSVGQEDGGPAVVVNVWDRIAVERWIFTAAHELGHLLMHPDAYDVHRTEEHAEEEREADEFGGHLLMPDESFWKEWSATRGLGLVDRVFKVKHIYGVSWQTVLHRFTHSLAPSERATVWQNFQEQYARERGRPILRNVEPDALARSDFGPAPTARASEEPESSYATQFTDDRLHYLVRQAIEQGEISVSRGAEILDLDLTEMRALVNGWVG